MEFPCNFSPFLDNFCSLSFACVCGMEGSVGRFRWGGFGGDSAVGRWTLSFAVFFQFSLLCLCDIFCVWAVAVCMWAVFFRCTWGFARLCFLVWLRVVSSVLRFIFICVSFVCFRAMFFSVELLHRKTALGLIWLAGTNGRRLTKGNIMDANVEMAWFVDLFIILILIIFILTILILTILILIRIIILLILLILTSSSSSHLIHITVTASSTPLLPWRCVCSPFFSLALLWYFVVRRIIY